MNISKLNTIDHLAITVDDINQSVSWYLENYTCEVIYADDTWAFLQFKNIKIALVTNDQHPDHFAVLDSSALSNKNAVKHRDGTISYYTKDLDNNYIEHIYYPSKKDLKSK
tara:strand:- start:94 stop:426 length:333 start_codon:yes stop_codon:yes gene_type:complete